ncbi:MAG: hypothetical protein AAFQ32_04695 [Pseudomonadota bacterium]
MTDFERINKPRVAKIMAMLDTIDKSARSQRVDNHVHDKLLDQIRTRIGAIKPHPEAEYAAEASQKFSRARLDYSVACRKADASVKACQDVADKLQELMEALPNE